MMAKFQKCFICSEYIFSNINSGFKVGSNEASFILIHILDIEHFNNEYEYENFVTADYCDVCLSQAMKIISLSKELTKLEIDIKSRKDAIKLKFQQPFHETPELINNMISGLSSNTNPTKIEIIRNEPVSNENINDNNTLLLQNFGTSVIAYHSKTSFLTQETSNSCTTTPSASLPNYEFIQSSSIFKNGSTNSFDQQPSEDDSSLKDSIVKNFENTSKVSEKSLIATDEDDDFFMNENNYNLMEITRGSGNKELKKTFICGICRNSFQDFILLKEHIKTHPIQEHNFYSNPPIQTTQPFDSKKINSHNNIKYKNLKTMNKQYISISKNIKNKYNKFEDNTFVNSTNFKYYTSGTRAKDQTIQSDTIKPHQQQDQLNIRCTICNWEFQDEMRLFYHLKTHTSSKNRKWTCNLCHTTYKNASAIYGHNLLMHRQDNKKYQCNICKKKFHTISFLKAHEVHEHSERSCQVCGKRFIDKWKWRTHGVKLKCHPPKSIEYILPI